MTQSIKNQTLNEPIVIEDATDVLNGAVITTIQIPFMLTEAQYIHLKFNNSRIQLFTDNFPFTYIGYLLSLIPKIIGSFKGDTDKASQISSNDWITIGVGLTITVVLYFVGKLIPNERKRIMDEIFNHFQANPNSHHITRKKK